MLRVSIHAPREGRDAVEFEVVIAAAVFQSTRPVKGATTTFDVTVAGDKFQSTRPVKGATSRKRVRHHGKSRFNPRAP